MQYKEHKQHQNHFQAQGTFAEKQSYHLRKLQAFTLEEIESNLCKLTDSSSKQMVKSMELCRKTVYIPATDPAPSIFVTLMTQCLVPHLSNWEANNHCLTGPPLILVK